ncbi:MAG: hypothetical protein HZB42_04035 [Sphingobacteriales bacterium]|nr:hypothetical protein [Sphingobacteriales bacterium]
MIKTVWLSIFTVLLMLKASSGPGDTTIKGVSVYFNVTTADAFPEEWQSAPTSAASEPIAKSEISRSKSAIVAAISKYPAGLLKLTLKSVYFFKSMSFFNVGFGGTNSNDAVYVTNDGESNGYTDSYLEQTFHHEYSSILMRGYSRFLDTIAWKNANIPGFDYNDPEAGVGAIRNNESSQSFDTALCKKGFLTQYAISSLENDLNTLAQNLFKPDEDFWIYFDTYPRIRQKVKLLVAFYGKLDKSFTEDYFRKFSIQQ